MSNINLLIIWISILAFRSDNLPNVLIIGDSISIGYTPFVKNALEGRAHVVHNPGNAQDTGVGHENLEAWLGDTDWDIIQFNWGLWDLCYRNPNSKNYGNLDKVDGQLTTTLEKYKENLDSIVQILNASTNAKLIFVTTTYVPDNEPGRYKEDVLNYNNAAGEVMKRNGILVNDIYNKSISIHNKFRKDTNNVHYTNEGYSELGKLILPVILEEIKEIQY